MGPVSPRGPEGAQGHNGRGPQTSHQDPDPHILSEPLSGEGADTPPGGVRSHHVSAGACTRARPPSFLGKTRPPTSFNTGDVKCAQPQQSPRRHLPGCTIDRALPRHSELPLAPRHAYQSATPVRHDSSAMEYHNAYAVVPTVYAATYTASTGTSPMGQVRTLLGQRVYRAMKRIRQEIHKALLMPFFGILYILVGPTCRGPTPVYV